MRELINGKTYDEERALYGLRGADISGCSFEGPADGESALKEASDIKLTDCSFKLRYPLWHVDDFMLENCRMNETTRAAIWYAAKGRIENSVLGGIKAVRECRDITIKDTSIVSAEFGWKSSGIKLINCSLESEYLFLDSSDILLENVRMKGKYSFQYVSDMEIKNSELDTKDAFWHAKNVTVRDSVVKGEYLGWYSENLTLINCRIIGTQPLCYCKNLKLINCVMEAADLAFEYSDVDADIKGELISVKNPRSGKIVCDGVGEKIFGNAVMECSGEVIVRS